MFLRRYKNLKKVYGLWMLENLFISAGFALLLIIDAFTEDVISGIFGIIFGGVIGLIIAVLLNLIFWVFTPRTLHKIVN